MFILFANTFPSYRLWCVMSLSDHCNFAFQQFGFTDDWWHTRLRRLMEENDLFHFDALFYIKKLFFLSSSFFRNFVVRLARKKTLCMKFIIFRKQNFSERLKQQLWTMFLDQIRLRSWFFQLKFFNSIFNSEKWTEVWKWSFF